MSEVWIVRHGETDWSRAGRHTGRTDVALNAHGEEQAEALRARLHGHDFALVLCSPLKRAVETARLAGFGDRIQSRDDLMEWDYGDYEGLTTDQIRADRAGWSLWRDGCPGGESPNDVSARADRVVAEVRASNALVFAHSHLLRVLTARWLGLRPDEGSLFVLPPTAITKLSYERDTPVI